MPEFQEGSFDPWGGPGHDACEVLMGPDFEDVFYKNNWAANIKMMLYYMFYGYAYWHTSTMSLLIVLPRGTSCQWGRIPFSSGAYTRFV